MAQDFAFHLDYANCDMSEVYLLGAGSIGGLVATQLSLVSKRPITLLLNSEERLTEFLNRGSTVRYRNLTKPRNPIIQDFQFKALSSAPKIYTGKPQPIEDLIVTTKSNHTIDAIRKLVPSLSKESNVILIQNGIGVLDQIREQFYPNKTNDLPNFYQGVISHGAFRRHPFEITHVGLGDLKICKVPFARRQIDRLDSTTETETVDDPEEIAPVVNDLLGSDVLGSKYVPYQDFLLFQYEKLVVNACINPLTAVLDSTNGELLRLFQTETLFKGIIREAVQVLKTVVPYQLRSDPTLLRVLDEHRLLSVVLNVCKNTKNNSSSMREDIRHLNNAEIDYINGYIHKQGGRNHVYTPYNKFMTDMVKAKLQLNLNRNEQAVKMSL